MLLRIQRRARRKERKTEKEPKKQGVAAEPANDQARRPANQQWLQRKLLPPQFLLLLSMQLLRVEPQQSDHLDGLTSGCYWITRVERPLQTPEVGERMWTGAHGMHKSAVV
mmetsp:Transcript_87684/g.174014  ORF Transcript_87684/g.174014 Transcript_87684/m.174014 type:complete len:111 (+) Transcript_87684:691-1023(+)